MASLRAYNALRAPVTRALRGRTRRGDTTRVRIGCSVPNTCFVDSGSARATSLLEELCRILGRADLTFAVGVGACGPQPQAHAPGVLLTRERPWRS